MLVGRAYLALSDLGQRVARSGLGYLHIGKVRRDPLFFHTVLYPLILVDHFDANGPRRARLHAGRRLLRLQLVDTHVALGHDAALFVKYGHFVGAVPCAVLAPYTIFVDMVDYAVVEFYVAVCRASVEASGVYAVVTAHRVEELKSVWEASGLHLSDAAPLDLCRIVVLLVAGHFTAVAPHTCRHIEVEAVLLSRFRLRYVDGVVAALHSGLRLVVQETIYRALGFAHRIYPSSRTGL